MKQYIITASLILFLHSLASSQNWRLFTNQKLNFQKNFSGQINEQIQIDSISVLGGDSIFHFNRIFVESGISFPEISCCNDCYGVNGQPGFLGLDYTKLGDGNSKLHFSGYDLFLVTNMEPGISFEYNSMTQDSARVDSVGFESFLGLEDSVKYISTDNFDSFAITKSHGLLRCQLGWNVYSLFGIQGTDIGESLPVFNDFFGYLPGDSLQYRFTSSYFDPNGVSNYCGHLRIVIDSVNQIADQRHLHCHSNYINSYNEQFGPTHYGEMVFSDSIIDLFDNAYPGMLFPAGFTTGIVTQIFIDYGEEDPLFLNLHSLMRPIREDNGTYNYEFAADIYSATDNSVNQFGYIQSDIIPSAFYSCSYNQCAANELMSNAFQLTQNFGFTYQEFYIFEHGGTRELVACRKGEHHFGDFSVFDCSLGVEDMLLTFQVYPNPSDEYVKIHGLQKINLQIQLLDVTGNCIRQFKNSDTNLEIDTSDLSSGLYFITIPGYQAKRLIKN